MSLHLARRKLRLLQPDALRLGGLLRGPAWGEVQRHLDEGQADAAIVLSVDPLRVAAYSRELDTVVTLDLPRKLGAGLREGQELVTLNLHRPLSEGYAEDLEPGAMSSQRFGDVSALVADLTCAPPEAVQALRKQIPEENYERCRKVTQVLATRSNHRVRDGRPGWLAAPDNDPVDELDAPRPPRRWGRRLALALVLLPALAFLGLYGTANVYLRHVPYTIPPELQAPQPGLEAALGMGLRLRYLGISGYEISDSKTTIWIDPNPTRATITDLVGGPLQPDTSLYDTWKLRHADFILVHHAHHDHVLDVPDLAKRTGAVVVGSPSVIGLCRSRGIKEDKLRTVKGGEILTLGTFEVEVRAGTHAPVIGMENPWSGVIPSDAGELWFFEYVQDGTRAYRLQANGTSLWFHPGRTFGPEWKARPAGVALMCFAGNNAPSDESLRGLLAAVKPQWVLPTHYDNFFHPLERGLALMPGVEPLELRERLQALDPRLAVYLLDFGQDVFLPPDPKRE
jgi:L-ascorbate metabolism protein UlaG (beta-lactamase superfamily)